jgi:hypothetical protein
MVVLEVVDMAPSLANPTSLTSAVPARQVRATKVATQGVWLKVVAVVVPEERVKPLRRVVAVVLVFRV